MDNIHLKISNGTTLPRGEHDHITFFLQCGSYSRRSVLLRNNANVPDPTCNLFSLPTLDIDEHDYDMRIGRVFVGVKSDRVIIRPSSGTLHSKCGSGIGINSR